MVFTNHMHLLPVSYIYVKEEIYFSKVIYTDNCTVSVMGWVLVHRSDDAQKMGQH